MSMATWVNYSYGFEEDNFEPTLNGINALLDMAPNTKKMLAAAGYDGFNSLDEVMDAGESGACPFVAYNSLFVPFVMAIAELEDVHLSCADDCEDRRYVIFPVQLPWVMTDAEHCLTQPGLNELFRKYLTIYCEGWTEDSKDKFGSQAVENFG